MNDHLENTGHLDEIESTPPGQKTISDILREVYSKMDAHDEKRDKKHKRKKKDWILWTRLWKMATTKRKLS